MKKKEFTSKVEAPLTNGKLFRVPFNIWKVMGEQTTGERLISSQAWKQYLQRYLKICAAFQIWRVDSPRNAQIDYAHCFQYLISKIQLENSLD